jgi:(2S)-methylsuccinyl-CoA dehydrogenase
MTTLLTQAREALAAVERHAEAARASVRALVAPNGKLDAALLEQHQVAAHGVAWVMTYATALRELLAWAGRLERLGEIEALLLQVGFSEYLAQLQGGLPMSQGELLRPADLGLERGPEGPAVEALIAAGGAAARMALAQRLAADAGEGGFGDAAYGDETLLLIREQFRKFADEHKPRRRTAGTGRTS